MYGRQDRLRKDKRKERLEQPELAVVMTKGTSSKIDQIKDMAKKRWNDYLKHTRGIPRFEK